MRTRTIQTFLLLLALASCGGSGGSNSVAPPATYSIGGTISGLSGTGLVFQNNSGNDLAVAANGSFTFSMTLTSGAAYTVTVRTQPSSPSQTCTVASGSGTISAGNISSVVVTCATNTFTVGGSVTGVAANGLVLQNSGSNNLSVTGSSFVFATAVPSGGAYNVTVSAQPVGQLCTVSNGSGTVANANVSNVAVRCGSEPEGVYGGSLTGGTTSSIFQLLVLENSDIWALYGTQSASAFLVAGFVQGSGAASSGSFTSTTTKDFGFTPAVAGTTNATYNLAAKTISGTISNSSGTVGFSGGPILGSLYDYNAPASLGILTGSWTTSTLTGEAVSLTISGTGSFTATSSGGCAFTGNVAPRPSGKNVFNVSISFGGAPCVFANQPASGIAVAYPLSNGGTQLIVAATDTARTVGTAAFGTR